jgi:serine protease Do
VADSKPGSRVGIRFLRDGREQAVQVVPDERPDPQSLASAGPAREGTREAARGRFGLGLETLTEELAQRLGVPPGKGVVVAQVVPGSPADRAGLRPGDVIADVGRSSVGTAEEFVARLRAAAPGETLALRVKRGPEVFYATVEVPAA